MKPAREVLFTRKALAAFEAAVPRKFRAQVMRTIIRQLQAAPDVPSRTVKHLSPDRPPYFRNKDVWQLRHRSWRFFYVLEEFRVVVFFAGRKDQQTTTEMVADFED